MMKTSSRTWLACMAGLASLIAVACDNSGSGDDGGTTPTPDGGTTSMTDGGGGGGGSDGGGGGGGDTDGGGGGGTDGGGGGGSDCASMASAYCARFMECNPNGFTGAYEDDATCQRVMTASCESGTPTPLTNGLTDQATCDAAKVADCDGFFSASNPPILDACVPLAGQVTTLMGSCFTNLQCGNDEGTGRTGRRMYCRPTSGNYGTADCPRGQCIPAKPDGSSCNPANQGSSEFCDSFGGQSCVKQFDSSAGVTGSNQCRTVTYGMNGDDCFPGSDMQCASGFECDSGSKTCMAALSEGATCDAAHSLCDHRIGLTCTNEGSGGNHCRYGIVFVDVGAQCGSAVMVGGRTENRQCSAYARCDTSVTPNVCVALVPQDGTCTLSPDNCEPGLECDSTTNTCQPPTPSSTCP